MNDHIKEVVFGTLLSLSIYGLSNQAIEWGAKKSPWNTKKVKIFVLLILAIGSIIFLSLHHKSKRSLKLARSKSRQ